MSQLVAEAVFWIAVACCAVAQVAILRSIMISPTQSEQSTTAPASHRAIEIGWAVLPGIALIFVFVYKWAAIHAPAGITPTIIAP